MASTGGDPPRISVVMPVRDGEAFLAEAVESILAQTFADFEFVILDDGSRDATPGMLEDLAVRDPRIRLHRLPAEGIVPALNRGLAASRGEFVARMDADDVALPHRLERQLARLEADGGLVALGSAALEMDATGAELGTVSVATEPGEIRALLATRNALLHPTVMARREALVAAGGYRRALGHAEDYDLWLRLSRDGHLANLPEPLLKLRRHRRQTSRVRELEQRAAAALARRLALEPEFAIFDPASASLPEALASYLSSRMASARPVQQTESADLAIMLRAAARLRCLSPEDIFPIGRRIAAQGRPVGGWLLPVKLWLGR